MGCGLLLPDESLWGQQIVAVFRSIEKKCGLYGLEGYIGEMVGCLYDNNARIQQNLQLYSFSNSINSVRISRHIVQREPL